MKKIMTATLRFAGPSALLALLLTGCADETPKDTEPGTPPDWQVRKVFEVGGCSVYQFRDWNTHYLTLCPGTISSTQRSGKTSYSEENPTVFRRAAPAEPCDAEPHGKADL